jgi:stress responsive alpha/beta barrel protein
MFRHVVLIKWRDDAASSARVRARDEISALPSLIPEIREYRVGVDVGETDGNFDLAVVADFDDARGYAVYRDHPAHVRVLTEFVRPILAARTAVQHER